VGDYQGRFTIADYLEKNIIDKQQNLDWQTTNGAIPYPHEINNI
jgi:hypothetical protein